MFFQMKVALSLLLTISVSVASSKRSFSKWKFLLSNQASLSVENKKSKINVYIVISFIKL